MNTQPLLLVAALAFLLPALAVGHDSRPLYVELEQLDALSYLLAWKVPPSVQLSDVPDLQLAPECSTHAAAGNLTPTRFNQRLYHCTHSAGPSLVEVRYLGVNPSLATLIRQQRLGLDAEVIYAAPGINSVQLHGGGSKLGTLWQYLQLGVQHIAGGYDHLLFVACLLLLASTPGRLLLAITGFTIAHSITLGMSALGVLRIPIAPTEAVIALSIVFLAVELVRQQPSSLAWRYPGLVATLFGLLHGFGFASVLAEIGLPQGEVTVALLGFNLGVEVGQLLFVGLLLVVGAVWRNWLQAPLGLSHAATTSAVAYPIGVLACFWVWERLFSFA